MNLAVARIIPPILLGIVIYAAYAITKPLCSEYPLHPPPELGQSVRWAYPVSQSTILSTHFRNITTADGRALALPSLRSSTSF